MNNIKDDKLEKYMSRIKESNNSNNKLLNYDKATKRLEELKNNYNNLCNVLKTNKNKPTKIGKNISIEKIISGLNDIDANIDNGQIDMIELFNNYTQYKLLLNDLESEKENIKNEIYKVDQKKDKISIQKLDPNELL